jgi:hypothetical protein
MDTCACGGVIVFGMCQNCLRSPGEDAEDYCGYDYEIEA